MRTVSFTPGALKSLSKLPGAVREAVMAKIQRYSEAGVGDVRSLVGRPGIRLRVGDYRVLMIEDGSGIEVFAVGHRREIYEEKVVAMSAQIITTDGGEELVVLPRREYDTLLARLGDEAAEDRMTAAMAEDFIGAKQRGDIVLIDAWFVDLVLEHGSQVAAARHHAGESLVGFAARLGVADTFLIAIENEGETPSAALLDRVAQASGIDRRWFEN